MPEHAHRAVLASGHAPPADSCRLPVPARDGAAVLQVMNRARGECGRCKSRLPCGTPYSMRQPQARRLQHVATTEQEEQQLVDASNVASKQELVLLLVVQYQ